MLQKPILIEEKKKGTENLNSFTSNINAWTEKSHALNYENEYDHRINETLKLNRQKLIGLSLKKGHSTQNFFTKPLTNDRASMIYRINYGADSIPKAAESDFQSCIAKTKPFIAPEYREYQNEPHKLPTFLKEKLIRNINPKSLGIKDSHGHTFQKTDHFADKNEILKTKSQLLPLVSPKLKGLKQETNYREIKQYRSYPSVSTQRIETGEFQYLSPKARQKMNSESVPILMSNVFLTGLINPSAFANQDEATIEYIITEHHEKTKHSENNSNHLINQSLAQRTEKKKLGKLSVAMSVSRQDKKIKKGEITLNNKTQKIGMDKIGMKLRATVGHLRMERELKRKKILSLLRTKNFNLFRTNTINNLHLLKEVL